eukprot:CAMPEP_0173395460 /NCGR_PEP_ID=MMETSP1356-20130122/32116_1 /TAXON_ID=77927 ORGANISM="Hemiselmis virescens, Strain PCC157" /NCGR_SAMPLE_ID=MMETSP1356 /ASSEMBLY_ACC=CAM_ASM_000847 /LENGTH=296 /DNA_ID=CAMNT_0014354193 /DNA_START=13 /DNA_END=903 /DNA_ORIENTATION=-
MVAKTSLATGLAVLGCVVLATFQMTGNNTRVVLEQASRKANQQQGPQTVPVITGNGFGTNSAFIGMGDGSGTSVKAHTTQLLMPERFKPGFVVHQKLPNAGSVGTDKAYLHKYDGAGQSTKARMQTLDQEYKQYGQAARSFYEKHGLMSKAEAKWANSMATGGEKAPVQMLAELKCGEGGACPELAAALKKAGLTSSAERKWVSKMPVEGFKAPVQMLEQLKCGEGGACPQLSAALQKAGLETQAERDWEAKMPVEAFRAPLQQLHQVGSSRGGAARQVGRGVTGYLFKKSHMAGL